MYSCPMDSMTSYSMDSMNSCPMDSLSDENVSGGSASDGYVLNGLVSLASIHAFPSLFDGHVPSRPFALVTNALNVCQNYGPRLGPDVSS